MILRCTSDGKHTKVAIKMYNTAKLDGEQGSGTYLRSISPDGSVNVMDPTEERPSDSMITTLSVLFRPLVGTFGMFGTYQSQHARVELAILRDALPFVRMRTGVIEN